MFREAEKYGLREPELIDMGSDFRINLYRKTVQTDRNGVIDPKTLDPDDTSGTNGAKVGINPKHKVDGHKAAILQIIQGDPQITQKEICEKTGIPLRTVKRAMSELQKSGKLQRKGSSRKGCGSS